MAAGDVAVVIDRASCQDDPPGDVSALQSALEAWCIPATVAVGIYGMADGGKHRDEAPV